MGTHIKNSIWSILRATIGSGFVERPLIVRELFNNKVNPYLLLEAIVVGDWFIREEVLKTTNTIAVIFTTSKCVASSAVLHVTHARL
jgi:hypothetical protein